MLVHNLSFPENVVDIITLLMKVLAVQNAHFHAYYSCMQFYKLKSMCLCSSDI